VYQIKGFEYLFISLF